MYQILAKFSIEMMKPGYGSEEKAKFSFRKYNITIYTV